MVEPAQEFPELFPPGAGTGGIAALEKVAAALVDFVEIAGIGAVEAVHDPGQFHGARFQQEVDMVGQENIAIETKAKPFLIAP